MKRKATKAEKEHMSRVAALGCILCEAPAEIHHIIGGGRGGIRADNFHVIPLCPGHHRDYSFGHAVHNGTRSFESHYGTQLEMLAKVRELLGDD